MDSFGESKNPIRDARAWIYQVLTKEGVEWTTTQGNGAFIKRKIDKNGKPKTENKSLKDVRLQDWQPRTDPEWTPELLNPQDIQPFETMIGASLIEKLTKIISLQRYVALEYNESLIEYEKILLNEAKTEQEKTTATDSLEQLESDHKNYTDYPLEEFLRGMIQPKLIEKVKEYEKKLLEKEFAELYPEEKDQQSAETIKQKNTLGKPRSVRETGFAKPANVNQSS